MQLSIIIVNYNVKYFLEQCLCSVQKAIRNLDAEVWVADNASSDNSVQYLKPQFSWIKFVENTANTGFAKANNQALLKCVGEYILFLNPDTILGEECLEKCIAFMKTNVQAGALGVRMIDGSGTFLPESKRSFPSPVNAFFKMSGMNSLFPTSKFFSGYSLGYLDEFKNHEVDVLSGAFMLVKKSVLTQTGGFDEAFFMYGEDIDLSYRIQKSGWKNYYFSESTIIHFKGESWRDKSVKYVKTFYEAMRIFVKKHNAGRLAYLFTLLINAATLLKTGIAIISEFGMKTKFFFSNTISGLTKSAGNTAKPEKPGKTMIAGTEEEYEEVKMLLAAAAETKEIIDHIAINEEKENAETTVDELQSLVNRKKVTEIIFCCGAMTYSDIIDKIQKLPKKISFRFHAKGTRSIVGSDSKNTSGKVTYASANR